MGFLCQKHQKVPLKLILALEMRPNKAFKTDSQRLPFSVLIVGFCVYGGMIAFRGGVAHYLTRR
ncbi:hypothetical protein CWO28_24135 [Vibrio splendidus]|nr:hypothetical protein CWO28_24135 [Vibrio splendidus]